MVWALAPWRNNLLKSPQISPGESITTQLAGSSSEMSDLWAQKLCLESQVVPTPFIRYRNGCDLAQKDIMSDPSNQKGHNKTKTQGNGCAAGGWNTASTSLSQAASTDGLLVWPPMSSSAPGPRGADCNKQ